MCGLRVCTLAEQTEFIYHGVMLVGRNNIVPKSITYDYKSHGIGLTYGYTRIFFFFWHWQIHIGQTMIKHTEVDLLICLLTLFKL